MTPFQTHTGKVVPLRAANVDTDCIIRMQRCAEVPRDDLGRYAFESLRFTPQGQPRAECPFNEPRFEGASVLVAGANFGCGSSREMAVWALAGMGLRCVIAPSFGDIFYANCFQNGLLPVQLSDASVDALLQEAAGGGLHLEADLPAQVLRGSGHGPIAFDIEPLRRSMLLQGKDEIALSLEQAPRIAAWQAAARELRPWVYTPFQL